MVPHKGEPRVTPFAMKVGPAVLVLVISCFRSSAEEPVAPRQPRGMVMIATAFARARHFTASGTDAHLGTAAADPALLPLGTRIRIAGAQSYDGEYLVTDTGAGVKGHHIDLYLLSVVEAKQFGAKKVRVTVLEIGAGKQDARLKEAVAPAPGPDCIACHQADR